MRSIDIPIYMMDVCQKWFLTAVKHQWNLESGWWRGGQKKLRV